MNDVTAEQNEAIEQVEGMRRMRDVRQAERDRAVAQFATVGDPWFDNPVNRMRFEAAKAALQGLLACEDSANRYQDAAEVALVAVRIGDELLNQLGVTDEN